MNHLTDEQLNEYLDHESQEHAQIESHINSCDECSLRLATLQALFTELDSLPEQTLRRDLTSAIMHRVNRSAVLPKWLTLTVTLQAGLALITTLVAAPLVIEFMNQALPVFQRPSIPQVVTQIQTQWMKGLDVLSTFQMPPMPSIEAPQFSSLVILSTLAGACMFWLVGNGLLLRNQIK
jgi:anti-sigma factor RsiW